MPLPKYWATPEDFATLFQYFWHQDFPMDQLAIGAHRADWTIHIGVVVRNIADLMGLHARFETGKRTDAVLRSWDGDEVALEWEWGGVWGNANELDKLKSYEPRRFKKDARRRRLVKDTERKLKYAVLITYTHDLQLVSEQVADKWQGARWPLLLILVDVVDVSKREISTGREFKNMTIFLFDAQGMRQLRQAPAYPWNVEDSRWSTQTL